jgi:hypothetical protein
MVMALSICFRCGKCKECNTSNQGSICHECWDYLAKNGIPGVNGRLTIFPEDPLMKGFVIVEDENTFITISGTLYFFLRKEDAEEAFANLKKADPLENARIEETPAYKPFIYVLRSDVLKLLVIKEVR